MKAEISPAAGRARPGDGVGKRSMGRHSVNRAPVVKESSRAPESDALSIGRKRRGRAEKIF
jgi:hypothetical protein